MSSPAEGIARTAVEEIASDRDADGNPIHHGWPPCGGRRRWMAPFVLVLLAEGRAHGYALIARLQQMGVSEGEIDVGQVYRTLHCLERLGHVSSRWSDDPAAPRRRDYELTDAGREALVEWEAVMQERVRLIREFESRYRRSTGKEG
jgi:DNA-binding PadR family transcriptional regulator